MIAGAAGIAGTGVAAVAEGGKTGTTEESAAVGGVKARATCCSPSVNRLSGATRGVAGARPFRRRSG